MSDLYRISQLSHRFGSRTVLAIDDLCLQAGRLYTLIGENGAGKSTLLHILSFLLTPSSGKVTFRGASVRWRGWSVGRLRREVTLLQQAPYLFDGTVETNVAFGLRARGGKGAALQQAVADALAQVGMNGMQLRQARELSGGEIQRVAMARALAVKPAVLLLDEPLANVDRQTAAILERLILSLPAAGTTVIMTTHDPAQPARLGSAVIRLVDGRLDGVITPANSHSSTEKIPWLCPLQKQEG
jgi:tungstate transport system ATP-binding protein